MALVNGGQAIFGGVRARIGAARRAPGDVCGVDSGRGAKVGILMAAFEVPRGGIDCRSGGHDFAAEQQLVQQAPAIIPLYGSGDFAALNGAKYFKALAYFMSV